MLSCFRLYENVKTVTRTTDGEENTPLSISRSSSINSLNNNTGAKKSEKTGSSTISAVVTLDFHYSKKNRA